MEVRDAKRPSLEGTGGVQFEVVRYVSANNHVSSELAIVIWTVQR